MPDSLGELFGRVTELLGLNANLEEHKVQWLSVAGDDRNKALFLDILCLNDAGLRLDRGYFSTDRISHGGFGGRFYERLGLEDPEMVYDLPAGGKRIVQRSHGYIATFCRGELTYEDGVHTGAMPGRLVRGGQRPTG